MRRRYLDLITSPATRDVLRARSAAIHSLRTSLAERGFIELETPILQRIHGGANARPFMTHINAYDLRLYLRIAPELYLKRLAVGGVERVFELGRTFRNEGVSFKHNPEFTMLEAYQAYADYSTMLHLTRELIQAAALAANGETIVRWPAADGTMTGCDISGDWPVHDRQRRDLRTRSARRSPPTPASSELRRLGDGRRAVDDGMEPRRRRRWKCTSASSNTRHQAPTFYTDFPTDVSPLTRAAPPRSAAGRAVGPGRVRHRARHRLLRADRPDRAAQPADRAVAAGGRRRPGGDGTRRGLPDRDGIRDAADRRARDRRRPARHAADRPHDPGDAAVPDGAPGRNHAGLTSDRPP